jgi:CubicO group peptidase (beta-lactamase class C family)
MPASGSRRSVLRLASALAAGGLTLPLFAAARSGRGELEQAFEQLRAALGIPQLSGVIAESGTVLWTCNLGASESGRAPPQAIASLTKPFMAALAFRLAEQGRLSFEASVERGDGTRTALHQLLTHTAAGSPGTRFLYSSDLFRRVGEPLARAAGMDLGKAVSTLVLRPARLRHTAAGAGLSPASGLRSTASDLVRFVTALERGAIVSRPSLATMFAVPRERCGHASPYAHGWFVQRIEGQEIRWHFGQQPDASALLVSLPDRALTFVLLARGDRLSSPFWLQFGDLRASPAALLFLSRWAGLAVDPTGSRWALLQALVALSIRQAARAAALVDDAVARAPDILQVDDRAPFTALRLLAAFARSGQPQLRARGRAIAQRLLALDPAHPRVLVDLAVLNLQEGEGQQAQRLLQQVIDARQAPPEIHTLARELLKERIDDRAD